MGHKSQFDIFIAASGNAVEMWQGPRGIIQRYHTGEISYFSHHGDSSCAFDNIEAALEFIGYEGAKAPLVLISGGQS